MHWDGRTSRCGNVKRGMSTTFAIVSSVSLSPHNDDDIDLEPGAHWCKEVRHAVLQATQEIQSAFLEAVETYGAFGSIGYRHLTMRNWSTYAVRYTHTFAPRLYRVADPAMRILRREELDRTFVLSDSVSFTLHIPDQVSAFNPAASWEDGVARIVDGTF